VAELKTQPTDQNVEDFINSVEDEKRRQDCRTILQVMQEASGEQARMWGNSIVGLGSYHYKYASGREGEWFLTGFSPRKRDLTLYIMAGFDQYTGLLERLGKHKTGVSCLYIKRVDDIDLGVLKELVARSVAHLRQG
jgi:hypothetical protein